MRWGIRFQLLLPLLLLLLGVLGISAYSAAGAAQHARSQIETKVRNIARTLSQARFPLKEHVLEMTKGLSGADFLLVNPAGGSATTLAQAPESLPPIDFVTDDPQTLRLGTAETIAGHSYLVSGLRLQRGPDAGAVLYILYPTSMVKQALWSAAEPSLVFGVFGGAAAALLAIGVAQRTGQRIQELERRTRLIADGDFSPMPLPDRNDELRDLGRSVNDMAQRLDRLHKKVQETERLRVLGQVSAGLAHQLRNGVTGARLAVEVHARECTSGADPESLSVALRQLARVEANLRRFLDLGRDIELRREACSLNALLDAVVALVRPQCRHAHIDLRWQPVADCTILGDRGQLEHLFLNLLDNAIEAAGPGGTVELRMRIDAAATHVNIEVLDSGPGPPAETAARLFEPFVTSKREGVGLGLVVARRVAEAHGGSIRWRRTDGLTCFGVELPQRGDSS